MKNCGCIIAQNYQNNEARTLMQNGIILKVCKDFYNNNFIGRYQLCKVFIVAGLLCA